MWYVIQTTAGHEEAVRKEASIMIPDADFRIIYRVGKYNYKGKWVCRKKIMFTGYIFVVTDHIDTVVSDIWKISDFAKPVKLGDDFVPISDEEQKFLECLTGNDETIEESIGFIYGDEIRVTEGPLKGFESRIVRIDRHKRLAYIEFDMGTRKIETQLCLNVLEKKR